MAERTSVGWAPWLPWPFRAWPWWTEPVRAERLAVLRIGLAAVLLVDIVTSYLPHLQEYFSTAWFGAPDVVGWWSDSPRLRWSLLRGVAQPLESALLLFCWMTATLLVLVSLAARLTQPREHRSASLLTWSVIAWIITTAMAALGFWARSASDEPVDVPLLGPWNAMPLCLQAAAILWAGSALTLLLGFFTRTSAVVVWLLTNSFSNLNPYIDNAGDAVRSIVVFYLMLCPCGAAWSVDSWRTRRRNGQNGPFYVSPWPLRLLFIQMVYIYFCNGLVKVFGPSWQEGNAFYYVLSDLNLSRISFSEFPVPALITRLLTWAVLIWELGFPLWVALPWTRTAALVFGVAFHFGTLVTMEIGGFVPYMLVLYVPLLRWGKCRDVQRSASPT